MSEEKLDVVLLQTMVQAGAIKLVPVPVFASATASNFSEQVQRNVKTLQAALNVIQKSLETQEKKA